MKKFSYLKNEFVSSSKLDFILIRYFNLVFSLLVFTVISVLYINRTSPISLAADCSLGTITVSQASFHEVVIDQPNLDSTYVAYEITTGAGDSFDDLWVRIENFSDLTKISLATNEDGLYHVGPMGNNETKYVYFYVNASATAVAQSYDLNLFEGNPTFGVSTCTHTASHDKVGDEIQAAANKVTSVVSTAPYIGGTMTITVTGDTGSMSSSRPEGSVFVMTPASVDAWPADCYELYATEITFSGGNTGTYYNSLVVTGLNSPNSSYTVIYSFKATCSTLTPTSVTPVNYISSGGSNLKHTDTGTSTYTSIPPVPPAENRIVMTKSVSPGGSAGGGTATYTLRFTNTAPIAVTIDTIIDTLASSPANTSYTSSSSYFDAVSKPDPNISGQVLTWGGSFIVPANSSKDFTYDVTVPATNGEYINYAIAFVGNTQIDQTIDTTDNTPASTSYGVGDPNLTSSTKTVSDLNGGNVEPGDTLRYTISVINSGSLNATGVDVTDNIDTDTENVTNVVVAANASSCGSSFIDSSTASTLSVVDIDISSGGNCDITFDVTVKAGTLDNTDILNTATVGGANEGGVGGSPTSTPLSVQLTPNLVVTKTENDADNYVNTSQVISYTITIDNNGDADATGVDLYDQVTGTATSTVSNLVITNCGTIYTNSSTGNIIDIANVDVALATNCVIAYDVTVDAGATNGQTISNSVDVGVANEGGNDPAAIQATTLTVGLPPAPNLSVTKTEDDGDNIVAPGQVVTYTVTISNSGNATGTTSFTDVIDTDYGSPSNFSYTNCGGVESNNFVSPTLTVSNLAVTTTNSCVVTYQLTVDNPSTEGATITNSVDVAQAVEGGNNPAAVNATQLTVDTTPNLVVSKSDNDVDNTVTPGQSVTYSVTIQNTGDGAASTSFTDIIDSDVGSPGSFTYTNCGTPSPSFTNPTLTISSIIVNPGTTCTVTYIVVVDNPSTEGATINNSVDVTQASQGGNNPISVNSDNLTIDTTPALAVTKTEDDADNSVAPNQVITYTITISNSGNGTASTSLTDTIDTDVGAPGSFNYTNCGSPSPNFTDPTLSISSIVVGAGASCTITYQVTVDAGASNGSTITNGADVAQATEGGNNPAIVNATTLTVTASPNLIISKSENDIDNFVTPGQSVTYTIAIQNTGNSNATTTLTDVIDAYFSVPGTFGYTNCGSASENFIDPTLTISSITIGQGTTCTITYQVSVDTPLNEGTTLDNSVDVAQAVEGGNNPSPVSATQLTVDATPNLVATKTDNDADDTVLPSQSVTYTVTIQNTGDGAANTSFTDIIDSDVGSPGSFNYSNCGSPNQNFSNPTLTVSNIVVAAGTTCTVTYVVVVDNPSTEGAIITNSVDVAQANQGGNNPAVVSSDTLTVNVTPNLSTSTKTENDGDDTVTPGQTFTYTITLINTGDGLATGVDVTDTFDNDITGLPATISITNCGSSYTDTTTDTSINITDLEILVGTNCVITIDVVVDSPLDETETISNTATISAANEGGSGASPTAPTLTVDATPVLSVTKTENDADNDVTPNQIVNYSLTITNSGNGTATGVDISDLITGPVSTVNNFIFTNCGGAYNNTSSGLNITISDLTISTTSSCVITYDSTISSTANDGQTISNTADVTISNEGGNNPVAVNATTLTVDDGVPIAVNDSATVSEDSTSNTIDWDDSDTLTDNATLNAFDATSVQGGAVSNNGNGTFSYTPAAGFVGNDSFNYTICDDDIPIAHCDSATVNITVNDQGSPVANNDSSTLFSADPKVINWDNNDSLTDNALLTTFDTTSTKGGTISNNGDGSFTYTPPSKFAGSDSFNYTICDDDIPTPACDSATVNIVVNVDLDGISDTTEGNGPNYGDVNGDGKPDNTQSAVSSLPNPQNNNNYVSLESGDEECGVVNKFGVVNESDLEIQNEKYDFPIGLFDFTIACTNPGDSTTITFYLDKIYDTSNWVYIKYDGSVLKYDDLPGVSFGTANVGGQSVTTISYLATDGDFIDEDKLTNGTIVDPSGPAVLAELVDTGKAVSSSTLISLLIISTTIILIPVTYKSKDR